MHIVYIGWAHHIHLRRWAGFFANLGYRVTILSLSPHADPLPKIRIIKLFSRNKRFSLKEVEVALWLHYCRPDVCHAHWAGFGSLIRKNKSCPFGITVWGSDIYKLHKESLIYQERIIEALHSASFITCDSIDQKKRIMEIANVDHKVHLIQWGVDTCIFRPGLRANALRKRLGIPETTKVILSPRSINPVYETETIIDAFAELVKAYQDVALIQKCYNADNQRLRVLQKMVKDRGLQDKVHWIGEIPYEEMPILYNMSDIMVSVPSSDGTPISLLEAMACGIPPIVSRLPSVLEWVQDGVNGLVVPVRDPFRLHKAMLHMLKERHLCQRIERHNLRIVKEKASQDVHMAKMKEIYDKVRKY